MAKLSTDNGKTVTNGERTNISVLQCHSPTSTRSNQVDHNIVMAPSQSDLPECPTLKPFVQTPLSHKYQSSNGNMSSVSRGPTPAAINLLIPEVVIVSQRSTMVVTGTSDAIVAMATTIT